MGIGECEDMAKDALHGFLKSSLQIHINSLITAF